MQTLHFYPTNNESHNSNQVLVVTVPDGMSEQDAYANSLLNNGPWLVKRDRAFACLGVAGFRDKWRDIIVHSAPLTV